MSWRPAFWLAAILTVAVDQATKQWALSALEPGARHPLVGELLSLQLVFNSGAAFSFGNSSTWILTVVALGLTAGILWYGRRASAPWAAVLLGLGLGGAVGNLIDRLFREPSFGQGHVVDFINYGDFFIGNVADIAIVGAAVWAVVAGLMGRRLLAHEGAPGGPAPEQSAHGV
ncbi:signal peptidase II [Demequina capsici]|uniref:Lipoprotein signal peptidase n=1 Tax=Demequina capsici TaxID=3075620 RepID=A0AA96FBB6_9MICO|nr:signal peptidase II [Demequina sp. PMTSA13]WNM26215.1 signal peptidase II [Demequina sp. PMTSA13]